MEKAINKFLVFIPAAIVILTVVLILNAQFDLTGKVVQDKQETEKLSRYIFYNTLRASINPEYSNTCYPKAEVMMLTPDSKCCEGLTPLGIIDEAKEGCNFATGVVICSDCGNQLCEYGENNCNCPEDCNSAA